MIKLVSYNVQQKELHTLRSDQRIWKFLEDFDILLLQEVVARSHSQEVGVWEETYPYSCSSREMRVSPGRYQFNWIFSKVPMLSGACVDLHYFGRQPRTAVFVDLVLGEGTSLRVGNTHFGLRDQERHFQISELQKSKVLRSEAMILAGDFNDWSFSLHQRLIRDFDYSCLQNGFGFPQPTFPSSFPIFALDRVYFSSDLEVHRLATALSWCWRHSDHRPLACQIRVPGMVL